MKTTRDQLAIRTRPRQRGYVLLCAIAVLLLGAVILVGMARWSLSRIVLANEAQEQLQLKWGVISSKKATLPYAEQILQAAEQAGQPTASVRARIPLGKQSFTVVIGDEQAKLNPNAMLSEYRKWEIEQAIREALRGTALGSHVRLEVPARANPWPIGSFAQILGDVPVERLVEAPGKGLRRPTSLTCWSDGRLNILRASDAMVEAVLKPAMGGTEMSSMLQARKKLFESKRDMRLAAQDAEQPQQPDLTTASGRDQAAKDLAALLPSETRELLTGSSTCHSIWVLADTGRLRQSELTVIDTADSRRPRYWSFAW